MEKQPTILPYFHSAQVGDKVLCNEKGEGEISFISKGTVKLITVGFKYGGYWIYSDEGKSTDKSIQTLFYFED